MPTTTLMVTRMSNLGRNRSVTCHYFLFPRRPRRRLLGTLAAIDAMISPNEEKRRVARSPPRPPHKPTCGVRADPYDAPSPFTTFPSSASIKGYSLDCGCPLHLRCPDRRLCQRRGPATPLDVHAIARQSRNPQSRLSIRQGLVVEVPQDQYRRGKRGIVKGMFIGYVQPSVAGQHRHR